MIVVEASGRDLGDGFVVRRALPQAKLRHVGPFVFFDQFGPVDLPPGAGFTVRPHPHIGIATVTWLFEGQIVHRDSVGAVQPILPGAVNWMHAGRGVVHSERASEADAAAGQRMSGIQVWVALPVELEDSDPWFRHYPAASLPVVERNGLRLTVIAGEAFGARSPVHTSSPIVYVEAPMPAGGLLEVSEPVAELGAYVAVGRVIIDGIEVGQGAMVRFDGGSARLAALEDSLVMLIGGEPMPEERKMAWNFVASTQAKIDAACVAWEEGRFPAVPGETEFIPLPDHLKRRAPTA